jgi:hypothetical protein
VKRRRILVNLGLAAALALVAFGAQLGYLGNMTDTILAATTPSAPSGSCGSVDSKPAAGDTLSVCGSYTGTIGATITVTVAGVNSAGRITSVKFTSDAGTLGPQGTYSVSASTGKVNGGTPIFGQTYTFQLNGSKNQVNTTTWTFGEKPGCQVKSKC